MSNNELAYFGGTPSVKGQIATDWPRIGDLNLDEFNRIVNQGIFSCYGDGMRIIKNVEREFEKVLRVKHALFVNSGTDALFLAYYAAHLRAGDEVIVPAYTYPATITPLFHFGVKIVLADIEEDSYNISIQAIKRCITDKTKAIAITHMRGLPVEMEELLLICRQKNIFLVEDCSHGLGAVYHGESIGTFGSCGCFSLSSDKIVSGGTAGIIVTNNDVIYKDIHAALHGPGREGGIDIHISDYDDDILKGIIETGIGFNFKSSPIIAELVLSQLRELRANIDLRTNILNSLTQKLKTVSCIITPKEKEDCSRGGWYGYRPFYNTKALNGLKKEWFIKLMQAEGAEISASGIKPFFEYRIVSDEKIQKVATAGRMQGNLFSFDPNGFSNTIRNANRTIKFPVGTRIEDLSIYDEYILAIKKIESNIETLPREMFDETFDN